jgi:hypothetical protein
LSAAEDFTAEASAAVTAEGIADSAAPA